MHKAMEFSARRNLKIFDGLPIPGKRKPEHDRAALKL
jgi:hypothetical protein